jgi:hypothetical protein
MTTRRLALCLVWLALLPLPAFASGSLDFTWRTCGAAGGDSMATFRCDQPDSVVFLNGCFRVPKDIPKFFAMDVVVDIESAAPELPPFWHLEKEGCNRFGVMLVDAVPDSGCSGVTNPWGTRGASALSIVTAYGVAYGGIPNRGRLLFTVTRASTDPIDLLAANTYFGFQLQFFNDNAKETGGECTGCRTPVTLRWTSSTFYRLPEKAGDPEPPPVVVDRPGRQGSCVRANGAPLKSCAALGDTLGARGR